MTADQTEIRTVFGSSSELVSAWLDSLSNSEHYWQYCSEHPEVADRIGRLIEACPQIVPVLCGLDSLAQELFHVDFESERLPSEGLENLRVDDSVRVVAQKYKAAWLKAVLNWLYNQDFDLGPQFSAIQDQLLIHIKKRLYLDIDVFTLGCTGSFEPSTSSTIDLLLLANDSLSLSAANSQAKDLVEFVFGLQRLGAPLSVNVRFRPGERQEQLCQSYSAFKTYDFDGMTMSERFSLGSARLVDGSDKARAIVEYCAYALPLTPERLKELVKIKRRIETEEVQPKHVRRNVRLGYGGLSDIDWMVHLHEMRYPTATKAGSNADMVLRIKTLGRVRLMNAVEIEELLVARHHLLTTQNRLWLLGMETDILPENPDKLDKLAKSMSLKDANCLLQTHEHVIEGVRRLYLESLERLRA